MPHKDKIKASNYQRGYYKRTKDSDLKKSLKKRYNMTFEQKQIMYISQNGCCAICQKKFIAINNKDTHIDHNHYTGQNRQLLCNNCNVGIGYLKEDVLIIANALEYIRKWNHVSSI